MNFEVPKSPSKYTLVLTDFLGADFTSIVPDKKHSPTMKNVINSNGYIENRHGYEQVGNTLTGLKINGVWNIDTSTNIFIVHAGTKLYEMDNDFENEVELLTGLNDAISQGLYLENKLHIFDGKRAMVYGKYNNTWQIKYLDDVGYIPTTVIGRKPDGTGGAAYEDINLVQSYRINNFLPDGVATTFKLESAFDNEAPTATILNSNGTITSLTVHSFDNTAGTVTFSSPPPVSPVPGRDSVFVKFKVKNTENISYINKCSIATTFGYDGNNNRIFITGNSDFPNVDWYSDINDGSYFPVSNYTRVGFEPIQNYLKLNDGTLAIQKKVSDTDSTIYYRKSATYNGQEVFPISSGVKTIGCISKYANANLLNDPLTLTEVGVYGIRGSSYQEKFAMERSYYVNKKLLSESNLENATAIVFDNKYYLAINNHVYIADGRYKTRVYAANNSDYEYEWYYWDNVPVRIWFIHNDILHFGTSDGKIVKFNTGYLDFTTPVDAYYDTGFLDCGIIDTMKTGKQFTVITQVDEDTQFELGYELDDGTTTIINRYYYTDTFPKILQEKEKTEKFMHIKIFIKNNTNKKMSFYQIAMDYVLSGRYRGE